MLEYISLCTFHFLLFPKSFLGTFDYSFMILNIFLFLDSTYSISLNKYSSFGVFSTFLFDDEHISYKNRNICRIEKKLFFLSYIVLLQFILFWKERMELNRINGSSKTYIITLKKCENYSLLFALFMYCHSWNFNSGEYNEILLYK